jgi:O-antigen/teichoic acid export membrane protein
MSTADSTSLLALRRNFAYAAISSGSAVLLLAVLVLAGRRLGDEAYGRFSFALALATIGEALMDFGLHQVTVRAVARDRSAALGLYRNSIALKLLPALLMVIVISLFSWWTRPEHDVRMVCVLLAISAVMRSYMLTIRGVLQGLENFGHDSAVVVLDRLLLLVLSAAVLLTRASLVGLAWAFVAARVLALGAALAISRRHTGAFAPAFDFEVWKNLQRRARPLGAFLIVLSLYAYVDAVMLGLLTSDVETGLYSAAYRIYEGLTYAPAILSSVLTPRLATEFVQSRARHAALTRQALVASLALAVILALIAWVGSEWALSLLFGREFAAAARALRILSAGLIVVFPIWILHSVAISVTAERVLLRTTAIGVVVNVALNFLLIPAAGRDGAAMATVIGEALSCVLLVHGLRTALVFRGH